MCKVDVPSPINLRLMSDAKAWEQTAMQRPFREEFFDAFVAQLRTINKSPITILELGSGPGFLAQHVMSKLPQARMTLLDFSAAMHELARQRLEGVIERIKFVERSFKDSGWETGLGKFDAVVTNQAVHELGHKRRAEGLHVQVKSLLKQNGVYLVCDHYFGDDGMKNDQLYMSLEEQRTKLQSANYDVTEILVKGGRALYSAT